MAKSIKSVTAAQDWKNRMSQAKIKLPDGIGQQRVIEKVIELDPDLDSLANSNRWRNAWFLKVSDPHITLLVEAAVTFFIEVHKNSANRLRRQKLTRNFR